jgi:hypothetical protein
MYQHFAKKYLMDNNGSVEKKQLKKIQKTCNTISKNNGDLNELLNRLG